MATISEALEALEGPSPIVEKLNARRILLENPPPRPAVIFKLAGQQICTPGNLTVIAAQAKSGKSATVGAMMAAILASDSNKEGADTLGFLAAPSKGKAVIFFDTEQSPFDSWRLLRRAADRVDPNMEILPSNFRCSRSSDVTTEERTEMLLAELKRTKEEFGGIHCVLIDGVGDFCRDPNNTEEAFDLVEKLMKLSVEYDCPFILVLHENPYSGKGGGGKTRGHLGSHLERKAESNLKLERDGEHILIFGTSCRSAHIPKSAGIKMAWDDEAQMHLTVDEGALMEVKSEKARIEAKKSVSEAWGDSVGALTYGELLQKIQTSMSLKKRAAENRIQKWSMEKHIEKRQDDGKYIRFL